MHTISLLEFRNSVTLLWLMVSIVLVVLFGWYLFEEIQKPNWWDRLANKLAVPLFVYFAGGAIVGIGTLTLSPHHLDRGLTVGWVLFVSGGALSMFGAAWIIYTLAPRRGLTLALASLALFIAVMLLSHYTGVLSFFVGP